MDVDATVAWWVEAYLSGMMSGDDLSAALRELGEDLPPIVQADVRRRLTTLTIAIRRALSGQADEPSVHAAAAEFLGAPPAEVLREAPPPAWRLDG